MSNCKILSIILALSIVTCAIIGTVNASAFEQQEINLSAANSTQNYVTEISNANAYKENETTTAKNDTIQTANIYITSPTATNVRYCERILVGNVSISDSTDYYQIYVEYGKTYKIKLIPVTKNVDINLHLYSASGTLLASSALATAYSSEYIDALWGHRRNPVGYAQEIERFDVKLGELLPLLREDDLLILTADHGNDPTHTGTDHTRERVPFLAYSPSMKEGRKLEEQPTFAVIGASILDNFDLHMPENTIGTSILSELV